MITINFWATNVPLILKPPCKLLLRQLQKRLPSETPRGVKHCRRQRRPFILLLNLVKRRAHTLRTRKVCANPRRVAAAGVDLVDDGVEVGGVAREENDGVGLGEFTGDAGACAGANAGDDGKRFGGHFCE